MAFVPYRPEGLTGIRLESWGIPENPAYRTAADRLIIEILEAGQQVARRTAVETAALHAARACTPSATDSDETLHIVAWVLIVLELHGAGGPLGLGGETAEGEGEQSRTKLHRSEWAQYLGADPQWASRSRAFDEQSELWSMALRQAEMNIMELLRPFHVHPIIVPNGNASGGGLYVTCTRDAATPGERCAFGASLSCAGLLEVGADYEAVAWLRAGLAHSVQQKAGLPIEYSLPFGAQDVGWRAFNDALDYHEGWRSGLNEEPKAAVPHLQTPPDSRREWARQAVLRWGDCTDRQLWKAIQQEVHTLGALRGLLMDTGACSRGIGQALDWYFPGVLYGDVLVGISPRRYLDDHRKQVGVSGEDLFDPSHRQWIIKALELTSATIPEPWPRGVKPADVEPDGPFDDDDPGYSCDHDNGSYDFK